MKLLFVGYIVPENEVGKYPGPTVAGNKFQLGIINALKKLKGNDFTILSIPPIAAFPKSKKLYLKQKEISFTNTLSIKSITIINIPIIKQISVIISLFFAIRKWAKNNNTDEKYIIFINALPEMLIGIKSASLLYGVKSVCLLADAPIAGVLKLSKVKQKLEKYAFYVSKVLLKTVNGLIVLNQEASKKFSPKKPCLLMEGGVDQEGFDEILNYKDNSSNECNKTVLYSGMLTDYNGIRMFIESISFIKDPNLRVLIYGFGPLSDYVKEKVKDDSRIFFGGMVSNKEIMKLQREATILINPRLSNEEVSKVTFPSKLIEYMISKRPVMTTKLNGIPKEYYDYLLFIENETPQQLANDIEKVLKTDSEKLDEIGRNAFQFIKNYKTWDKQCQRIIDYLHDL